MFIGGYFEYQHGAVFKIVEVLPYNTALDAIRLEPRNNVFIIIAQIECQYKANESNLLPSPNDSVEPILQRE